MKWLNWLAMAISSICPICGIVIDSFGRCNCNSHQPGRAPCRHV